MNAEVLLFGDGDKLVLRGQSDVLGEFALSPIPDGVYQLVVRMPGFFPFRGPLSVDQAAARNSLQVQLGVGSCSTANAR
jgi:hypothetical protein